MFQNSSVSVFSNLPTLTAAIELWINNSPKETNLQAHVYFQFRIACHLHRNTKTLTEFYPATFVLSQLL